MPHCSLGRELKVGDIVLVRCVVVNVQPATDYCNVTIKTTLPMPPYADGTSITLNTKQVESVFNQEQPETD